MPTADSTIADYLWVLHTVFQYVWWKCLFIQKRHLSTNAILKFCDKLYPGFCLWSSVVLLSNHYNLLNIKIQSGNYHFKLLKIGTRSSPQKTHSLIHIVLQTMFHLFQLSLPTCLCCDLFIPTSPRGFYKIPWISKNVKIRKYMYTNICFILL